MNNPLISVQPIQGQKLPTNWKEIAKQNANYQSPIEDMWKTPLWSAKLSAESLGNLARAARLKR